MAQSENAAQLQANEISKSLKGPLQEVIRRVERLSEDFPADKDFHFYNNFPLFKAPVRGIQSQAEALLSEIGRTKTVGAFRSDPDESYDWLVSLQDDIVEGIDAAVDQLNKETAAGKRGLSYETPPKKFERSPSETAKVAGKGSSERRPVPFHVKSIPRPQNKFEIAVDNSNTPFKHPQAPKADVQTEGLSALDLHARRLGVTFEDMHPLEHEIKRMEYVDAKMLEEPVPQEPRPIAETPLKVVSTLAELQEMAAKCRLAGEIAVDLENHHYRSFQGFVCLMQISTRSEDFIVDTLALRSHISPCLKDVFADAKIKKVMHGADRDIVWLQRDFGIYVCNLFDTGQAARVLQLEGFGLAFLMQHFLNLNPDKRYQLADWRIRPLPAEMIKYAREDTHYLLYLYDLLRVKLASTPVSTEDNEDNPILQVYKRSRDICLLMYKKDILTETSHLSLYGLQDKQLNPKQMSVLASLYAWRDKLARKLDESTGFVLPNQLLYKLAEEMPESTRTLQTLIRGPHSLVGQYTAEVLEVIKQSKEKAPHTSLSVPESKRTPVKEAGAQMDTSASKTGSDVISADVPDSVEEGEFVPEDGETNATPAVELNIEKEHAKADVGATTSIKEITVGHSMSPQVVVTRSSADITTPASTINIRKLNAAVVKRASAPSLALFGGSSKKKNVGSVPVNPVQLELVDSKLFVIKPVDPEPFEVPSFESEPAETNAVETPPRPDTSSSMTDPVAAPEPFEVPSFGSEPAERNAVETSSIPDALSSMTDPVAAKLSSESANLSNAVVEDIPEGVVVTVRPTDVNDGEGGPVPSSTSAPSENDTITDADQAVVINNPVASEGHTASVAENTSLAAAGVSIESDREMERDAPLQSEASGSCSRDGLDAAMVAAEETKPVDSQAVKSAMSPAVVNSGVARQGLGFLLGSRKRQKKSNEDMEMVAAKLRAERIQASVALPFHRVPEQDTEMVSEQETDNAIPTEPVNTPKQEAAALEELGDYVTLGKTKRESGRSETKSSSDWSKEFATEEERPFPRTLSDMRRQPNQKHPAHSSSHQKQKDSNLSVEASGEEEAVLQPFDYEAARREAGLGENLVHTKEDGGGGRGRGRGRSVNPNKRQKQMAPPSTGGPAQAFDPLRRVRQEPRPEGIPAAKRRQVFPQTGNRTASFRR